MQRSVVILTVAIASFVASATAQGWQVAGEVRYVARDALASWSGVAPLAGEATFDPNDPAGLLLRARVATAAFSSGNFLRDQRARARVFRSDAHPEALLVARAQGESPPLAVGATITLALIAELTLAGVTRTYPIEATITTESAADGGMRLRATATFAVSLTAHGMERPALLGLVTEDAVVVQVSATAQPAP
jgi:polyisoprenoid-binding protein YceI